MRAMVGIALAATLLALPGCGTGIPDAVREYLERQANPFDLEQPLAKDSIGNVDGYRVFLAGETHTKAKDKQAEKLLVRYFHEHEGVRYLLWETGFGSGLLLAGDGRFIVQSIQIVVGIPRRRIVARRTAGQSCRQDKGSN